ncbi:benzoyl-CoA reductase, bzd-type, subunit N [Candidatus Aalborgicola defluviihabitans]|uniref:benzoyl-CoA reductase, bzd-type, subunit N n=1 Tax=Candidatus Aalborgicola defluviihabitans TaxID=3386187 RepID=UPI001D1E5CB0|nr:benzoyl-CoA reductase, bzd-type, subunit N [Burkholderiales bacterium]MBK6567206.1 benzoyl-CoA reductase, bzd-type, subunit N [Burkholderiales bacterium]MBK7314715.1 benzoyl-CoA reductase, bzd-type, subunit N [Burkholderiales bacterium]
MSELFDQFKSWYEDRHDYAREWKKRTGGRVVATMCTYTPEEVLIAAGMLPVRVLGAHEPQNVTEPHIFGMFCPFSRDSLAQGLLGRYDYCEGVTLTQSCIQYRQTFTSWRQHVPTVQWDYYLPMPNEVQSKFAKMLHQSEVKEFRKFVEGVIGKPITDDELRKSTELVNENRRLLHELYEYRKEVNPRVTGVDALYASITAQFIDKEDHNRELKRVLALLPSQPNNRVEGVRFMTIGSENDDVSFMAMVESVGSTIVIDDQCSGTRNFWNEARIQDDPIATIADRYCERPACPTKDYPVHTRFDHVLKLAKDYNARAAVFLQQKFCDPHEGDYPDLKEHLEKNGIPTLFLEFDITNPIGPFRIRIEAFLETMSEEELF